MGKPTAIVATVVAVAAILAPSAMARASNQRHHKPRDVAPPVHCDLFASPSGSDSSGDGSLVEWKSTFEPNGVPEDQAVAIIQGIYTAGLANL